MISIWQKDLRFGAKGAFRFRRQQRERLSLSIYRAALADLEKKINNAGAKWAGIDEGKAEMKKIHHAEKELDPGQRRLEAVRKVPRKESRFESVNYFIVFFPIDPLEHDQLKGVAV